MCESLTRAIARGDIPSGAKSKPFSLTQVSEKINLDKIKFPLQVGLRGTGELEIYHHKSLNEREDNWFWIKCLQFATDCHVQNVRICKWQSDAIILQVTKDIRAGDELFLWFGEDVLVNDLGIPPYLNPHNIRGRNNYKCHKCREEFEAPNPLKVHLALDCGTLPVDDLWVRMARLRTVVPPAINVRMTSPQLTFESFMPHIFGINSGSIENSSSVTRTTQPLPNRPKSRTVTAAVSSAFPASNLNVKSLSDQQAHLETIMSNMGRGKNGHHVCVYCGKLYSRKYGLKIHIRTHTGFKPLQCKICHRPFGDPSNLNKHVRLHADGNTPYRCEICTKVLVRRRDLDRHIRSRHSTLTLDLPPQQSAIDCSIQQRNTSSLNNNNTETNPQTTTLMTDS